MNIEKYTICSAAILLEYYDNKIQSFLENCHDDILWLGPAHDQMIRGILSILFIMLKPINPWVYPGR